MCRRLSPCVSRCGFPPRGRCNRHRRGRSSSCPARRRQRRIGRSPRTPVLPVLTRLAPLHGCDGRLRLWPLCLSLLYPERRQPLPLPFRRQRCAWRQGRPERPRRWAGRALARPASRTDVGAGFKPQPQTSGTKSSDMDAETAGGGFETRPYETVLPFSLPNAAKDVGPTVIDCRTCSRSPRNAVTACSRNDFVLISTN